MKGNLQLEVANEDDALEMAEVINKVHEEELRTCHAGEKNVPTFILGYETGQMQEYRMWDNKYFKIVYEGTIIGGVLITSTGREHGTINRIYILPEFQNRGFGSKIIDLLEQKFSQVKYWQLESQEYSTRNVHFFEKKGYKIGGVSEGQCYLYKILDGDMYKKPGYHTGLHMSGQNIREGNWTKTDWFDLNIQESFFTQACFEKATFQNVTFRESRFCSVYMSGMTFGIFEMQNAEFSNGILAKAYIHDINLIYPGRSNLKVERCIFNDSIVKDCDLSNMKIEDCNLKGATIDGICVEDMISFYRKYHNEKKENE